MPIKITFQKFDEHGNEYYVDEHGNRVEEEQVNQEELEAWRSQKLAELQRKIDARERRENPFAFKALGNLRKPKARKVLWAPHFTSPSPEARQAPAPLIKERGAYWAQRELCVLAGDGGVGKSFVALQVAKELAEQNTPPNVGGVAESRGGIQTDDTPSPLRGTPPTLGGELKTNRILYVDWELDEEEFLERWGPDSDSIPENFMWVGRNGDCKMPEGVKDKTQWLFENFATTVRKSDCNVLIIDQPDRLYLSPQKWNEFLFLLKDLMRELQLSVMLVLSNKVRHLGRACGLNNIPKGNIILPVADSVVMMAASHRRTRDRYFKVLKSRNRPAAENLEEVDYIEIKESDGYLKIEPWGRCPESYMMPMNAAERKNQKIMEAEKLWNSGMSCFEVAEKMYIAESTVKSWLRPLLSNPYYNGGGNHPAPALALGAPLLKKEGSLKDEISLQQQPAQEKKRPVVRVSLPGLSMNKNRW